MENRHFWGQNQKNTDGTKCGACKLVINALVVYIVWCEVVFIGFIGFKPLHTAQYKQRVRW